MAGAIWDYLSVIPDPRVDRTKFAYSGDIYEQAVVKTVAGFFRGNPTHLFGVTRFGAPVVYVRAGSIHFNEVAWAQSPGAESSQVIPQSVA